MRTRTEIRDEIRLQFIQNEKMIEAYDLDTNMTFEEQFSKVSFENVLIEIMSFIHFVMEQFLETHRTELNTLISQKKLHTGIWIREQLLNFQYGFTLIPGTDQWNNTGHTEEEIEQSRIIKYAAVTESVDEKRVICKIATENGDELEPLQQTEIEAVSSWLLQIKATGVPYTVINYLPDRLALTIQIFRDPLILTETGVHRITGKKTVEGALQEFMKELPFNGELRIQDLSNKLEGTEGVHLVNIQQVQTCWIDPTSDTYGDWEAISVRKIPESGYFKIEDINNITYTV